MADYQNILVAVDFSETADTVINRAMEIARRNHTKLNLIHVVEYLPPIDIAYEPVLTSAWTIDEHELVKQASASLKKFCLQHALKDSRQMVVVGTPRHEITQYAKDHQCDLVVIGSHGRHGLGLLLGSTANGVLHDMPCDVLAVKINE